MGRPINTHVYLGWDRHAAMLDFILMSAGTIEVPPDYELPVCVELPPFKWSVCNWPRRQIIVPEILDGPAL